MEKRVRQQIPDHRIWKIYGTEYKEITKTILAAADLAGRRGSGSNRTWSWHHLLSLAGRHIRKLLPAS